MRIRRKLLELARAVADEAERNPAFAQKLVGVVGLDQKRDDGKGTKCARSRRRRPPAVFDPVAVLRVDGARGLRSRLSGLDLEQLKDMVAQYGMDPGKLVMKWKTWDRVADRIVEMSANRAQKGDAFRENVRKETGHDKEDDRGPGEQSGEQTE